MIQQYPHKSHSLTSMNSLLWDSPQNSFRSAGIDQISEISTEKCLVGRSLPVSRQCPRLILAPGYIHAEPETRGSHGYPVSKVEPMPNVHYHTHVYWWNLHSFLIRNGSIVTLSIERPLLSTCIDLGPEAHADDANIFVIGPWKGATYLKANI